MKKNIGQVEVSGFRYNAGQAYITIPKSLDRATYILDCYRTKSVSVVDRNGAYYSRVPITDDALDQVQFPASDKELGSIVLWRKIMPQNKIVIDGVFSRKDKWDNREENSFIIKRESGSAAVSIEGSGNKGNLLINVEGDGLVNIAVSNDNNNAEVNLTVQGNINIISDGTIEVKSDDIRHNDGSQQMVKGNYLKEEILDALLDILIKTRVQTSIGQMPFLTIDDLIELKTKTEGILSEKSRLQ